MTDTKMAYSVYYYDPNGIGYGMAGTIKDNGTDAGVKVVPGLKSGLNGSPQVLSFPAASSGNALMLAVTDYEYATNRTVYIYNYAATGALPLSPTYSVSWPDVDNPYSIVRIGEYLYVMDYDNARVVELYATAAAFTSKPGIAIHSPMPHRGLLHTARHWQCMRARFSDCLSARNTTVQKKPGSMKTVPW